MPSYRARSADLRVMLWIAARLTLVVAVVQLRVAEAHHSNAQFRLDEVVRFAATVTAYEWKNPHVFVQVETTDDNGEPVALQVEGDGTSVLVPLGWSRDSLEVGDRVWIEANPARSASRPSVLGRAITKQDGTILFPNPEFIRTASPAATDAATGLNGVWLPRHEDFFTYMRSAPSWSLTELGQQYLDAYDGSQNVQAECVSVSSPAIMVYMVHTELEVLEDRVIMKSDWMNVERVIYTDGRTHPEHGDRTPQGHTIGHWEGDALVMDTRLFSAHPGGLVIGVPSGLQKHLRERLTLQADGKALRYEFVLEDPEYLLEPVTGSAIWHYRPELEPAANECDLEAAQRYLKESE